MNIWQKAGDVYDDIFLNCNKYEGLLILFDSILLSYDVVSLGIIFMRA